MRLKDKLKNKVDDYTLVNRVGEHCVGVAKNSDIDNPIFFDSLAELCERFEDAPEKIKPFEEVVEVKETVTVGVEVGVHKDYREDRETVIKIADQDYYEILPDGTKKTKFTWDEAMGIEKKTHGKWRVPTQAEWFAIAAAFGAGGDGKVTGETLAKNLNLTTNEDGYGNFWSSSVGSTTSARYLGFSSTYVYPQYNSNKVFGFTVRCVAR